MNEVYQLAAFTLSSVVVEISQSPSERKYWLHTLLGPEMDSNSGFSFNFTDNNSLLSSSSSELPSEFTQISDLNKWCIIVYITLFLLAAVGNLIAFFSVSCRKRVGKSRIPLLIMNLCVADLIVTFFLMPTEIFWRLTIAWKGGDVLCKLSQFWRAFGLYLSCNVVICISIDRYYSIVHPLKLVGAVKRVKMTLIGAWTVSAVFAAPQIFVYHVASHPIYPTFRQCITKSFLMKNGLLNELLYNIGSVSALYFIPLFVIIYTYTKILWELRKKSREQRISDSQRERKSGGSKAEPLKVVSSHLNTPTQPDSNDDSKPKCSSSFISTFPSPSHKTRLILRCTANQKATLNRARLRTLRLTFLILLTFIFCWTPYVVMTIWYMVDRTGASQVDETLQEALFIMAVANSVINPLVYGTVGMKGKWTKENFVLKLFHSCSLCLKDGSHHDDSDIPSNVAHVDVSRVRENPELQRFRDLSPTPRMQVVIVDTTHHCP